MEERTGGGLTNKDKVRLNYKANKKFIRSESVSSNVSSTKWHMGKGHSDPDNKHKSAIITLNRGR